MAKMQPSGADVEAFLEGVPDDQRRADARELCALLSEITGERPVLWASGIVGFGTYHYRYDSGREGDAPLAAFAVSSANLVVYLAGDYSERDERLLERLGPHRTGKSCLYVKRLADIDVEVLRALVTRSTKVHRVQDRAVGR
jgi:hypothetical protein